MRDVPLREKHRIRTIELFRSMDRGKGPVYSVNINNAGEVQWDGQANVKVKGPDEWMLSNRQFHRLEQEVRKAGVKTQQINAGTDIRLQIVFVDGTVTDIAHPEVTREVPVKVFSLENAIDKIIGTYKYVGRR